MKSLICTKGTRSSWRVAIVTAQVVFAVAYVVTMSQGILRPQRPSILSHARRIALPREAILLFGCQWIDPQTILSGYPTRPTGSTPEDDSQILFVEKTDVKSQIPKCVATVPLERIPDVELGSRGGRLVDGYDNGRVSSNGRWSIWAAEQSYEIVSLDGRHFHIGGRLSRWSFGIDTAPYYCTSRVAWMRSSDRWVEMYRDSHGVPHLLVHQLEGKVLSDMVIGPKYEYLNLLTVRSTATTLLGVTPENHALLWDGGRTILDANLTASPVAIQRKTIITPTVGKILDIALSPDGTRILWRTHILPPNSSDTRRLLERWGHLPPLPGTHILWLSGIDGSQMKEIGRDFFSEVPSDSTDDFDGTFDGFRWMPDGKSISFTYRGELWTRPIR